MQELAEKVKNWKDAAIKKEISKKKRGFEEFRTQHDQESRTVSLFFSDPEQLWHTYVPHQTLITSSF